MIPFVTILIILACLVLAFFVLIQNPKGGGLAGSFGSLGNQVMGVKQSTDVMEKGTWTSMAVIAALCLIAVTMYETPKEVKETKKQNTQQKAPAQK
jgi:preprotein translocase subunit SecG